MNTHKNIIQWHCLFVFASLFTTIGAGTVYVVEPGTHIPSDPYNTWTNAATNIHVALAYATANALTNIVVSNGHYGLTGQVSISTGIYMRSWGAAGVLDRDNTILGAYGGDRCLYMSNANAVVRGFTLTGGVTASGGGVYINGGMLRDSKIIGCQATGNGGGIYIRDGFLVDCVASNNTSDSHGGGVFAYALDASWAVRIYGCTISSNAADAYGGGIRVMGGDVVISNCTVERNFVHDYGGGIYLSDEKASVRNCRINYNMVSNTTTPNYGLGGGVYSYYNSTTLEAPVVATCVINSNTAYSHGYASGGGVAMSAGLLENCEIIGNFAYNGNQRCAVLLGWRTSAGSYTATLRNCLIVSNQADIAAVAIRQPPVCELQNCTLVNNRGRGLRMTTDAGATELRVDNSILYFNELVNFTNHLADGNQFFRNSCITPIPEDGADNTDADPLFISRADGNYRLLTQSPCIDKGLYQNWMPTASDLDGRPRIDRFRRIVDMGCYECLSGGTMISIY